MPDYFLKKKSLLDRFKDNHGRTGYIQSARAEHTWSNPIKRNRRTKELNGWIKSFAGKKHIRKLARFNTLNNGKNENLEEAMNWINVTDNTKEILENGSEKSSLNTIEDVVADLAYAQAASDTAFGRPTTAKSILWKAAENFKASELNFDDNGSFIEDFIVNYEDQFREIYPYAVQDCDWLKLDPDFDKTYNSDDKFPFVEWVISQVAKELFKYAPADVSAKESNGVDEKPTEAIQINPPIVMYKGDAENAAKAHDYLYKKMPRVKGASISSDVKPLGNNKFCRVLFYGNKTGVMELFRYYSNLFNHDFLNNCDADPQGWVDPQTIARYDVATPRQESKKHESFNTTRDLNNFALHILNYIKDKTQYPGYVRFVKLNDDEEDFYGKYFLSVNGKDYYLYVGDTDYTITDNNDENTLVEGSTDLSGAMNKDLDDFCERIQQPFYTESKKHEGFVGAWQSKIMQGLEAIKGKYGFDIESDEITNPRHGVTTVYDIIARNKGLTQSLAQVGPEYFHTYTDADFVYSKPFARKDYTDTEAISKLTKVIKDFYSQNPTMVRSEAVEPTDEKLGYEKGHKNSKGEDAPWVIRSHKDNRVLASFTTKKEAEDQMQRMKQYSKTEKKSEAVNMGGFKNMLRAYNEKGGSVKDGPWRICDGAYDLWFELYYNETPILGCTDNICKWYSNPETVGMTLEDYKKIEDAISSEIFAIDSFKMPESKQSERKGYAPYYFCRSKYTDGELAVLADGDSIHYLPSYNIKGFKDKIDYGTIATSFEPIENPETSELHKIVQRKDGRNIIALTQAEFDDFAENNGWGGRDKWFKDILRNRHIIESNDTRERAVDDYDTLTDGLSELGFVPSSDIRNGLIYPYRSRFTAMKDGVKYHFWIHEDPSGEYTDYIEVWGGKFTTNGDPEDPEATKFNTVSDVLDNLKSVKKSEAMAGKHESKDVSLKEIARTLDTAINKDGNYSVKDNTSGVTATDKDRTQTIKVSKDLKVELEDKGGKHSYVAQSLRDLSKYIRRAVKGEYVNEDFHKTQVKDAVYDVINRHNLNNAVKVSYLGNSVVCKYADRTLRIQPDLLTTMSTKDGDNVDTYPTNLKELDGYLDRVFGHYADELAESKQSEGIKLDYVDTITVPQWLWDAYLLGNEYGGDLTDDEQTILYDFKEKYKDCHLDDRGEEPDFHSCNDFDCYGGNCYVVDVYTKTDVKEKKSEKLFNTQDLEAYARGADILDQLQYRFSFSFYSPKTYTDAVDTALAMNAEGDKRIAHETIGDSEFRLYTDDPYDAIRFRDGLSNRAGIPAEDLASTFRSAVGIRKNRGYATEDEQDTIGRYAAENYVSFSVSEDNSTMYVEGELPNVVEFLETIK